MYANFEHQSVFQGSYGIVKLAYNEEDKNLYALKVLDKIKLLKNFACFRQPPPRRNKENAAPSVLRNPLQLVQKEIAILKKLSHPNVVKLVEVLDDPNDNYLYMVFEFVEKGSILEIPTDKPLDEDTAWSYFRDTLCGLEYREFLVVWDEKETLDVLVTDKTNMSFFAVHYQKIVHRDIKPSNLLLSDVGQVKVSPETVWQTETGYSDCRLRSLLWVRRHRRIPVRHGRNPGLHGSRSLDRRGESLLFGSSTRHLVSRNYFVCVCYWDCELIVAPFGWSLTDSSGAIRR